LKVMKAVYSGSDYMLFIFSMYTYPGHLSVLIFMILTVLVE